MDPMTMAQMGTQGAIGIISAISGLFDKARARRLARANIRPEYVIPSEIKANQLTAQQMAKEGMNAAQYGQQQQAIGRNANAALMNAQDRRGGLAAVGAIQQNSDDSMLKLNVADANMRLANVRNLMQQNSTLAQFRDKAFAWNKQAKFQENAAAIRALQGAGNANINNAMNSFGNAALIGAMDADGGGTTGAGDGSTMSPLERMRYADYLSAGGGGRSMPGWNMNALPFNDRRIR